MTQIFSSHLGQSNQESHVSAEVGRLFREPGHKSRIVIITKSNGILSSLDCETFLSHPALVRRAWHPSREDWRWATWFPDCATGGTASTETNFRISPRRRDASWLLRRRSSKPKRMVREKKRVGWESRRRIIKRGIAFQQFCRCEDKSNRVAYYHLRTRNDSASERPRRSKIIDFYRHW